MSPPILIQIYKFLQHLSKTSNCEKPTTPILVWLNAMAHSILSYWERNLFINLFTQLSKSSFLSAFSPANGKIVNRLRKEKYCLLSAGKSLKREKVASIDVLKLFDYFENGMLPHSLGGVVIFISLKHFIAPALDLMA